MRIATYNVEWFSNLFDDEGTLLADADWSGRHKVTRADQAASLGIVFTAMDADAVMVIEAPDGHRRRDGVAALENFASAYGLRTRKAVMGFVNDTQQEIALLYDPDVLTPLHDPQGPETGKKGSGDAPRFDGTFRIDLDIDNTLDTRSAITKICSTCSRSDRTNWSISPAAVVTAITPIGPSGPSIGVAAVYSVPPAPKPRDKTVPPRRAVVTMVDVISGELVEGCGSSAPCSTEAMPSQMALRKSVIQSDRASLSSNPWTGRTGLRATSCVEVSNSPSRE